MLNKSVHQNQLEPVVKQVKTPEPVIELVESPEPDVELIKAPEAVFELVSSPEPVVGLVKTPEPVVELVKLPSSEQVAFPLKSTWSKPEEVKVKTPESSEGHTGRIKSPRSAEKQPYKPVQSPFPQTTETLISLEGELVGKAEYLSLKKWSTFFVIPSPVKLQRGGDIVKVLLFLQFQFSLISWLNKL